MFRADSKILTDVYWFLSKVTSIFRPLEYTEFATAISSNHRNSLQFLLEIFQGESSLGFLVHGSILTAEYSSE
jgi:hypothetical protein